MHVGNSLVPRSLVSPFSAIVELVAVDLVLVHITNGAANLTLNGTILPIVLLLSRRRAYIQVIPVVEKTVILVAERDVLDT